jgi:hypothetical protein
MNKVSCAVPIDAAVRIATGTGTVDYHIDSESVAANRLQVADVHHTECDRILPFASGRFGSRPASNLPTLVRKQPGCGGPDVAAASNQNRWHFR